MRNRVKYLRMSESVDMTQEQLAKAIGVSRDTIARVEAGREPSGGTLMKLSAFFNKDPREIFFVDDVV